MSYLARLSGNDEQTLRENLLGGWILHEVDARLDVGLETLDGFVEELFLVVVGLREDVDGLLNTVGLG